MKNLCELRYAVFGDSITYGVDHRLQYKKMLRPYPDAYIFIMTPYEARISGVYHTEPNKDGYTLSELRDAIITVAEGYSVPVLDLFVEGGFAEEIEMPFSDGIHPTPDFVARRTAPDIDAFLKEELSAFLSKSGK